MLSACANLFHFACAVTNMPVKSKHLRLTMLFGLYGIICVIACVTLNEYSSTLLPEYKQCQGQCVLC